jgi:hypothetical protein
MYRTLFATFILVAVVATVYGQAVTGTIFGNVSDSSGGVVASAVVRAVNTDTTETRSTTSDPQGAYLFPALPAGRYRVETEVTGFKKVVRDSVGLGVNQNARVDLALEVGSVTQEVHVREDAPLVDTREAQVGSTVDRERVEDLPLNGRNVYGLVSILPGVSKATTTTTGDNQGNFVSANGSRTRQSNFLLDGGFNNNLGRNGGNEAPNPDAVGEFRLLTSNFDAEFGRLSGAVINVVTKSGTNQYHGALFEFLRNNDLNARNFFQPSVTPLHQNQFGATTGGPVIHNKTFFFASYQGLRIRTAAFINSGITPTTAERQGDFSSFPTNQRPVDPATGLAFPGGLIPASLLDPVAQNILKLVPLPNTPDGRLQASGSSLNNEDQGFIKIDHQIDSAHKITGSLFLIRGSGLDPFNSTTQVPNYGIVNAAYDQRNVVANEDWIVNPSLLNQVRFSYSLNNYGTVSQVHTSWSDFGSHVTLGALPPRPPQIFVNGFWQMGTFGDDIQDQSTYGLSDTLTWMRSGHSIRAGGGWMRHAFVESGNWLGAGQIRFSGSSTKNALADFELGHANTFRQNNGNDRNFYGNDGFGFFQDDWKISRKLTLNLGLRYEVDGQYLSTTSALQTFRFGVQSKLFPTAPLGLLYPGDPGIPQSVIPTARKNFAPRFGVAFDPFGNGKTAIRAGWGLFYAATIENITSNMQGQPFLVDVTANVTPNLNTPWANVPGGSPFPYTLNRTNPLFSLPLTASYVAENLGMPYVMQYNFTIQQQLTSQWSIQAGYVGNVSRKLYLQRDANAPVYIPGKSTVANVNSRRPYLPGTFAEIAESESAANADYSSLQVSLTRRFSRGFTLMANYTWSKSMDIASDDQLNPTVVSFSDSNNLRLDRAPSDFDVPQRLVVSYLWELPKVKRWGLVGKELLSGWQVNGITDIHSGSPFNVTSNIDSNFDGNSTDRPDLIGNPTLDTGRSRPQLIAQYFNTAAFKAAAGLDGTAGRNLVDGPSSVNWDFSAFKNFAITEQKRLQFRAELFNLFNEVNFSNPNATLTSPSFGRILAAGAPRIVQFSLKFLF